MDRSDPSFIDDTTDVAIRGKGLPDAKAEVGRDTRATPVEIARAFIARYPKVIARLAK